MFSWVESGCLHLRGATHTVLNAGAKCMGLSLLKMSLSPLGKDRPVVRFEYKGKYEVAEASLPHPQEQLSLACPTKEDREKA